MADAPDYTDFLSAKLSRVPEAGRTIEARCVNRVLHPFQREIVRWACGVGRAAIWADTGLGKTFMQIEWARLMNSGIALIVAPLAVCQQTVRESAKLGVTARYVRDG